jgi:hypothetical protein
MNTNSRRDIDLSWLASVVFSVQRGHGATARAPLSKERISEIKRDNERAEWNKAVELRKQEKKARKA